MRNRAMESMRSTQKREEGDEVEDVGNAQPKRKVTRKSGVDTVAQSRWQNWYGSEMESWRVETARAAPRRGEKKARWVSKATSRNDINDGLASPAATESNATVSADVCCHATTTVTNHVEAFRKTLSNMNVLNAFVHVVPCVLFKLLGLLIMLFFMIKDDWYGGVGGWSPAILGKFPVILYSHPGVFIPCTP